ncbi:hypothetical protein B0J13DRAFT_528562 [Dactylonectria estremocensis]|uniref:Uncharacterized protein n=1 Tax=Dactylonectria estremocensis TaxID=1079267 RepID=A0A9P9EFS8_9HYPO|nr:hypothetical protein B0J13DRAFT_528562 [Dactylonectria estremocensis]
MDQTAPTPTAHNPPKQPTAPYALKTTVPRPHQASHLISSVQAEPFIPSVITTSSAPSLRISSFLNPVTQTPETNALQHQLNHPITNYFPIQIDTINPPTPASSPASQQTNRPTNHINYISPNPPNPKPIPTNAPNHEPHSNAVNIPNHEPISNAVNAPNHNTTFNAGNILNHNAAYNVVNILNHEPIPAEQPANPTERTADDGVSADSIVPADPVVPAVPAVPAVPTETIIQSNKEAGEDANLDLETSKLVSRQPQLKALSEIEPLIEDIAGEALAIEEVDEAMGNDGVDEEDVSDDIDEVSVSNAYLNKWDFCNVSLPKEAHLYEAHSDIDIQSDVPTDHDIPMSESADPLLHSYNSYDNLF